MDPQTKKPGFDKKQFIIWTSALIIGAVLGLLGCQWLNGFCDFIASVYTRLFQFIAVPTIALAVTTTLAELGAKKDTGKIFGHTIVYTLLTTLAAAIVGAVLYKFIAPANLPAEMIAKGQSDIPRNLETLTVYKHILAVIPKDGTHPEVKCHGLHIRVEEMVDRRVEWATVTIQPKDEPQKNEEK